MKLITVPLDKLVGSKYNVNRLHPLRQKALRLALEKGFKDPIEICRLTPAFPEWEKRHGEDHYLIVDGHHRVKAAQQLGLSSIEAICFDYDPTAAKVRNLQTATIRGQLNNIMAAHTVVALSNEGMELKDIAEETGLRVDELDEIVAELDEPTPENSRGGEGKIEVHDNWRTIEIAVPPDAYDDILAVLNRVRRFLVNPGAFAIMEAIAAAEGENKRSSLEDLLIALTNMLMQSETGDNIVVSAEANAKLRKALNRAAKLAACRGKGRALELVVADFAAGEDNTDESYD